MSIFSDPTRAFVPVIKITAYKDKAQTKKKGSVTLPYDHESLDVSFENCIIADNSIGGDSGASVFSKTKPSELKVTFVLDDTTFSNPVAYLMPNNIIPYSVDSKIKNFKALCHTQNPETNEPHFVAIKSMNMPLLDSPSGVFLGLLTQMKIKNELVDALGNRVKARVECVFKHSTVPEKKKPGVLAKALKVATVVGGGSLVGMAAATYGSAALTAGLAAANGLNSLRKKIPGDAIKLPASDKVKEIAEKGKSAAETAAETVSDTATDISDEAPSVVKEKIDEGIEKGF
ncbi:hypothetical protein [uncultured Shewanella sp.]|uniref:CIS tube protein n=1 Tax=uncultured Shewanella sp. TaxID=173975 RepID=UPI00261F8C2C|nr:hypothetical protein [uncultured Shewanella sp.]